MTEDRIMWQAPEHDRQEHAQDWYWAMGIVTVSLAIAFFIIGNMLLSIIIMLGMGTLLINAKRPARMYNYELSKAGIRINKTLYPWDTLASFWIAEKNITTKTSTNILIITSKKPIVPQLVIPLGNNAPLENIRGALIHMLTEEPQIEPLAYRMMRYIGF
jgi:hypothetical protein